MRSRLASAAVVLASYASAHTLAATPPTRAAPRDEVALPGDPVEPRAHVVLTPHLGLGFGLPVGVGGASLEVRYDRLALEVGGGLGFGGPQAMVHLWVDPLTLDDAATIVVGLGWSTGSVLSRDKLPFGPEQSYDPARWLNLLVAPTWRPMHGGLGLVVRAEVGTMYNLAAERGDGARLLFVFGLTFGWSFRL